MHKSREEIIVYINSLKGYEGYVQFSHRPINKVKDIFIGRDPQVESEDGFIYEAHFANGERSISVKQVNSSWLVSETNLSMSDVQTYLTDIKECPSIVMAEIWVEEEDLLCEDMVVKVLQKSVFAGFEG